MLKKYIFISGVSKDTHKMLINNLVCRFDLTRLHTYIDHTNFVFGCLL